MDLKKMLRHVPDFPKKGIDFIDVTTVIQNGEAFEYAINEMIKKAEMMGEFDLVIGAEARGFIFGAPIACAMKKGFVPVRKKGKLPYHTLSVEYELEYGSDVLEMHKDAVLAGQKVLIVDDLLATGGTCKSNIRLAELSGGEVAGLLFFVEIAELGGRDLLKGYKAESLISI